MNVYISITALEEAICNEGSNLNLVLRKLPGNSTVFTDLTDEDLETRRMDADSDILSLLYLGNDTNIRSGSERMAEIRTNNAEVLKDATAIYILDVNPQEAASIQESYGVLCSSASNPNIDVLVTEHRIAICEENEPGDWQSKMFGCVNTGPLNSVIISDRYLLSDDTGSKNGEQWQFTKGEGYNNLLSILKCILPRAKRSNSVTVLLYFDAFEFAGNPFKKGKIDDLQRKQMELAHFKFLSSKLNKDIKALSNNLYNIEVELLSFGPYAMFHEMTHNRRVLTNYAELSAEHKLAAFKGNKCTIDQNITYNSLFAEGLHDKSDCPIYSHNTRLRRFADIFKAGIANQKMYLYSYCGQTNNANIAAVKNRLVLSQI